MNYTENYKAIKIDVQALDFDIDSSIQQLIRDQIDKIGRHASKINAVDIYFSTEGHGSSAVRIVGMRVGIPGPDVYAEEKGDNLSQLLKSVADKNIRQLEKL